MTRQEFLELTKAGIVYLDGATGSNLQKAGMPSGVCPDLWIAENPAALEKLQTDYLNSGTRILYAPTFTANRIKLAEFHLEDRLDELNRTLVGISKKVIKRFSENNPDSPKCYVAGDVTMTGVQLAPSGPLQFEELIDVYKEQVSSLAKAGADLIVIETMMSLQETRAAVIAAKEVCDLPIIATMTFEADGRSLYGTDPLTALITLQSLGVSAFGANCSTGPDAMIPMIKKLREYASIPVICKPNAGLPELDADGNTIYNVEPEEFGRLMVDVVKAGASIVGGCCGTTPEHIKELKKATENFEPAVPVKISTYMLSSERSVLEFGLDGKFMIIGERINPTGKKALQAELREGRFDMVTEFAEAQEDCGAKILDVNVGMSGIDEKELMKKAIEKVSQVTKLPLCIDTSHVDIMEAALRLYPGRALMNSISFESAKCEPMLRLAKKYGAAFVLLPLSDTGLPKNLEEKKRNIKSVLDRALEIGLSKSDIIVDGLVGTIGADSSAALQTLETIRYCREELGLATVCGLSNISFGLPERIYVNTAFLTLAINAGLTMAICNPNQELLVNAALASDLLLNKKDADLPYIDHMNEFKEKHADDVTVNKNDISVLLDAAGGLARAAGKDFFKGRKAGTASSKNVMSSAEKKTNETHDSVFEAVLKGKRDNIVEIVEEALKAGREANSILHDSLLPAINEVGVLFDKKKYFLPQLIASGEAMKNAVSRIEPLLAEGRSGDEKMPTVVVATVKGDIHDIGKNLVVLMMKNYGFNVIDLGKDVPREDIINAAIENKADIVAMSALMTTTMREMKNVIDYAKEKGVKCKFMVGGAVITPDYADEIGAVYSSDAADAVRVAKKILSA